MTALALDVAELPEAPEAVDHRAAMIVAGLCPQCGHDSTPGRHDLYGSPCRAVIGRDECMCEGPIESRRPRAWLAQREREH
jgi:hypothetical protein